MKLHPFDDCCKAAKELAAKGHIVFQQFNCAHCEVKQTMDEANHFFTRGLCEECGKETNIKNDGCNYMIHALI